MLNEFRKIKRKIQTLVKFPVISETFLGDRLYVNLFSSIGVSIHRTGNFDPSITNAILSNLKEGDTFIDIGANVGFYSIIALSKVGKKGKVFSFEIDPRSLRCLFKSKEKFKYQNLLIFSTAIGAENNFVGLEKKSDPGHSNIKPPIKSNLYPLMKLDNFIDFFRDGKPSLIKIDVEGYELQVLTGAEYIIRFYKPIIIFELNLELIKIHGTNKEEIFNFLKMNQYSFQTINGAYELNYICFPDNRIR